MNSKTQILDTLIDKYEKSKAYKEGVSSRRIMINLHYEGKSDLSSYSIENTEVKESFNNAVQELKSKGLVDFEWLKYEQGNIISRVWLLPERIDDAYAAINRQPKLTRVEAILTLISEISRDIKSEWIKNLLNDSYCIIEKSRSISKILPDDEELARDVLRAIRSIDAIGESEVLERVFSLRCFGDSKRFEKSVKNRVVTIIRKYCIEEPDSELTDEDILRQVGIIKAPEIVEFCGNLTACFSSGRVDYSPLRYGATINSQDIRSCKLIIGPEVTRVLFIENKANYVEYILNQRRFDELVIFHGGFYSPVKGLFFKKIFSASNKNLVEYYHWGDIDLGGFKIFSRLKRTIVPNLIPYNMGIEELKGFSAFVKTIDDQYADKVLQLIEQPELEDCYDTILYMVTNKVRLEQEAFI